MINGYLARIPTGVRMAFGVKQFASTSQHVGTIEVRQPVVSPNLKAQLAGRPLMVGPFLPLNYGHDSQRNMWIVLRVHEVGMAQYSSCLKQHLGVRVPLSIYAPFNPLHPVLDEEVPYRRLLTVKAVCTQLEPHQEKPARVREG